MKLKKSKAKSLALSLILLFLLVVITMQVTTNSIMREIKLAFFCPDFYVDENLYDPVQYPELYADPEVNYIVYQDDPAAPNLYAHFNVTNHSEATKHLEDVNIDLKLHRVFALHNFSRGTLWIKYSLYVTDKTGAPITGSANVPVKLTIQKVNQIWTVTDLHETP